MRWHRAGFRAYWRWKSRPRGGRPTTPGDIRRLIREMSVANPLWGAPRIHGELLKLGIDVGQTTVAKYMARRRMPPSPKCRPRRQGAEIPLRSPASAHRDQPLCEKCGRVAGISRAVRFVRALETDWLAEAEGFEPPHQNRPSAASPHAAMALYLARYPNVPPVRIPGGSEGSVD
jgi:hypothetical protein